VSKSNTFKEGCVLRSANFDSSQWTLLLKLYQATRCFPSPTCTTLLQPPPAAAQRVSSAAGARARCVRRSGRNQRREAAVLGRKASWERYGTPPFFIESMGVRQLGACQNTHGLGLPNRWVAERYTDQLTNIV
jgi:hypothetical protein